MLTGNTLKIIAAICMVIDHIGYLIFPEVKVLRIVGRIAFPVFAYMIAEGCQYTKNKLRYFGTIFSLAFVFQAVYYITSQEMYLSILFTFSFAILAVFTLQYFKKRKDLFSLFVFILCISGVYVLSQIFYIDYGFWGCMTPVFASALRDTKKMDKPVVHIAMTAVCLVFLALQYKGVQAFALLSVPLLLLYSGKRGKWNMKYFFYIFYPAHLVILQGISMIVK